MTNKKNYFFDRELINAGLIFLLGGIIVSILNYLYHFFMGRMLGPKDYGVLGSLFAIIYISTFLTNSFSRVISKYASEFKSKNRMSLLNYLIKKGFYKISFYGFLFFVIYVLITPLLARYMNLDSITGLVITGIVAYFSVILTLFIGILNGLQKFGWQNFSNIVSAFLKFSLAIFFVYLGYSVNGALLAIVLGTVAGILICYFPLQRIFERTKKEKFNTRKIYLYSIPVILASLFSASIITFDQILVKHYLSSHDAGLYAALGNIGKIIWFSSGFLSGVIFPKVVELNTKKKDISKILTKSVFITFVIAAMGCVVYFLFPDFIVNTFYGKRYLEISGMIGFFGFGMLMFSLTQILITFNLAAEKYTFIPILFIGLLVEIFGIYFYHNSLLDLTKIFVISNAIILILMIIYNIKDFMKNGN